MYQHTRHSLTRHVAAKSEYKKALHHFYRAKSIHSRNDMCNKRLWYKKLIKKKKNEYQVMLSKEMEALEYKSPKEFWSFFKNKSSTKPGDISDEAFYTHFKDLHLNDNTGNAFIENICKSVDYNFENCIYEELDKHITHEEIINVVKNLKLNKAHGIDNLINEYFMASIDILVEHISTIFNAILDLGFFPDNWARNYYTSFQEK